MKLWCGVHVYLCGKKKLGFALVKTVFGKNTGFESDKIGIKDWSICKFQ